MRCWVVVPPLLDTFLLQSFWIFKCMIFFVCWEYNFMPIPALVLKCPESLLITMSTHLCRKYLLTLGLIQKTAFYIFNIQNHNISSYLIFLYSGTLPNLITMVMSTKHSKFAISMCITYKSYIKQYPGLSYSNLKEQPVWCLGSCNAANRKESPLDVVDLET